MRHPLRSLVFGLLVCATAVAQAVPPSARPRTPDDFGFVQHQKTDVFAVNPRHVLVWPEALRRDMAVFQTIPVQHFSEAVAAFGMSYLTHLQREWNGILMETFEAPVAEGEAIHPSLSLRGSVGFPQLIVQQGFRQQRTEVGAVDGKGTGLSPEGEVRLRLYHSALKIILGLDPDGTDAIDFNRYVTDLQKHLTERRRLREEVRQGSDQTPFARANRDKGLEHYGLEIQVTEYLLEGLDEVKQGRAVAPAMREKILEAMRGLDYTNGLLPLDRAVKEFLMGIFWEVYFKRYNEKHGTNYSVVSPYAVMPLPVNILEQGGKKRRAGVLLRRASWRDHNDAYGALFPHEMIDPVIGHLQTDIFGSLIDLELPAFQLEGATTLLGWREYFGQAIDARCTTATEAWMAGDMAPLNALIAEVMKLANESPIPEKPLDVKGKLTPQAVRVRALLERLAVAKAPIGDADRREALALISDPATTMSEHSTVLTRVASLDSDAGTFLLQHEFDKIRTDLAVRVAAPGAQNVHVDFTRQAGAVSVLLRRFDPMVGAGTSPAFFDTLFSLTRGTYLALVESLSRSVNVSIAHTLGLGTLVFEEQSTDWNFIRSLVVALVDLAWLDRTTPATEPLSPATLRVPNPMTGEIMPYEQLTQVLGGSSFRVVFRLAVHTAERFTGRPLSERALRLLDPTGAGVAERAFIEGHVATLRRDGTPRSCALALVNQALLRGELVPSAK